MKKKEERQTHRQNAHNSWCHKIETNSLPMIKLYHPNPGIHLSKTKISPIYVHIYETKKIIIILPNIDWAFTYQKQKNNWKSLPVSPCVCVMLNPNLSTPDEECALRCSNCSDYEIWMPFKSSFGPFNTSPKHWRVNFGIWAHSSFSKRWANIRQTSNSIFGPGTFLGFL